MAGARPRRPNGGRCWSALVFEVPSAREDEMVGRLGARSIGAEARAGVPGWTRLRLFFDDTPTRGTVAAVEKELREVGVDLRQHPVRVERLADEAWAERYQDALAPFPLGRRFRVQPGSNVADPEEDGRVELRLVPSRAFGTGEHPTTRLCAERLEDRVARGSRWLDLGCGTAILALVAVHCGARSVLAVDHDGEALRVARDVVSANGLADRVLLAQGSIEAVRPRSWDGVVTNIDARFLCTEAGRLAGLLRCGGRVLASGFPADDTRTRVRRALEGAGLAFEYAGEREGWSLIEARLRLAPPA